MTRYARAKGSKASNERKPEIATSWNEMKKQALNLNNENNENNEKNGNDNKTSKLIQKFGHGEFVKAKEAKETELSQLEQFPGISKKVQNLNKTNKMKIILGVKSCSELLNSSDDGLHISAPKVLSDRPKGSVHDNSIVIKKNKNEKLSKKKKKLRIKSNNNNDNNSNKSSTPLTKKKLNMKVTEKKMETINKNDDNSEKLIDSTIYNETLELETNTDAVKKRKNPIENPKEDDEKQTENDTEITNEDEIEITKKKQKKIEKRKKFKSDHENSNLKGSHPVDNFVRIPHEKPLKSILKSGKSSRDKHLKDRRKPIYNKLTINGKEVEIDYVDGFPIKKEDADRIRNLRKELISKGISMSEINIQLKLERRKAEKSLAREKKKVCFNCRKSGHNLSECPEFNNDISLVQSSGTGICFKCGSTEHTHYECKVVNDDQYKFANCFICNEQGHIAKQCPNNSRGIYPRGGACNVCGDTTHLKRDCPKFIEHQKLLEDKVQVETIDERNPEDLIVRKVQINPKPRVNKIIKF